MPSVIQDTYEKKEVPLTRDFCLEQAAKRLLSPMSNSDVETARVWIELSYCLD